MAATRGKAYLSGTEQMHIRPVRSLDSGPWAVQFGPEDGARSHR